MRKITLSKPDITNLEKELINEVMNSGWLSMGPKVKLFEKNIAEYIGTKYAIAVNSGTSGLHLCIKSIGIKEGDEVITTPFSFIASSNCILYERAKPVFVDIDENDLNIDSSKIEEKITEKTKAILPVHAFGHPCEMGKINQIAINNNLKIIEDACEALGSEYKNKKVGNFSDAAVIAFYPNKQMTTGEGGIIVTSSEDIANLCVSMRNQGRSLSDEWLTHERLGYNYRLDDLSCAIGIGQLERIDEILLKREKVAKKYKQLLVNIEEVSLPYVSKDIKISWFVYVVRVHEKIRNDLIQFLNKRGVACKPYFTPIHLQKFYRELYGFKPGDFPICEKVASQTIALPFYNNLPEEDIEYVVESLKEGIAKFK